jgi:hypothetical protein
MMALARGENPVSGRRMVDAKGFFGFFPPSFPVEGQARDISN